MIAFKTFDIHFPMLNAEIDYLQRLTQDNKDISNMSCIATIINMENARQEVSEVVLN